MKDQTGRAEEGGVITGLQLQDKTNILGGCFVVWTLYAIGVFGQEGSKQSCLCEETGGGKAGGKEAGEEAAGPLRP